MIIHIHLKEHKAGWEAFVPGAKGLFATAKTADEVKLLIKVLALHFIAEEMVQGLTTCDNSIAFAFHHIPNEAVAVPEQQ